MKVQILLSTYNGAKYLDEQIESILEQKDVDFEILVRDDGSSDTTKDILTKYSKEVNCKLTFYNFAIFLYKQNLCCCNHKRIICTPLI